MSSSLNPPEKPGPKKIRGGIDHGKMWESISIRPDADPKTVAYGLKDSFNFEWIRELIYHFNLRLCELCGDPRCIGQGVPDNPFDNIHASGDCICETCGMEYRQHDYAKEILGVEERPFLRRLCDGRLVKL